MTDAHCHISSGEPDVRELLCGRDFVGVHPWRVLDAECDELCAGLVPAIAVEPDAIATALRIRLESDASLGVGEIGLDRLKAKTVPPLMRDIFEAQLRVAAEMHRPVVLHGAKCWGQVVAAIDRGRFAAPSFLFHGFSRSDGLLPDIIRLNGFVSVGPAVLNDHAVNYRELVKKIPLDRLLVETDRTTANLAECPSIGEVLTKLAEVRGIGTDELERITDANAERFLAANLRHNLVRRTSAIRASSVDDFS